MHSSVVENEERLSRYCAMVGAKIMLHEELLRIQNGDNTEGDVLKEIQMNSRHLVKRTDNSIRIQCESSHELLKHNCAGTLYIVIAFRGPVGTMCLTNSDNCRRVQHCLPTAVGLTSAKLA
jgi:RAB protein geranylgeranyltransferase component A